MKKSRESTEIHVKVFNAFVKLALEHVLKFQERDEEALELNKSFLDGTQDRGSGRNTPSGNDASIFSDLSNQMRMFFWYEYDEIRPTD